MALPRPSCTVVMDIDESLVDEQTRLEIKRCYAYVGSAVIRTHESKPGSENTITLLARLGSREFMDSAAQGADNLWADVMERWLYNEFHNIGNNMMIYNRRQEETGSAELFFDWFEVELGSGGLKVRLRPDSNCMVFPQDSTWVSEARARLNAKTLGDGVVRISMPSAASWERQKELGAAQAAKRAAEREAEELAKREEQETQKRMEQAKAAENFLENPTTPEEESRAEQAERIRAELEERYGKKPADFCVDFSIWDVEYSSGEVREFDSSCDMFL